MGNLKISKKHIVTLWHETQVGNIHTCKEKQLEFAEMMWALYEDLQPEIFDEELDKEYKEASARLENVLLGTE